MNSLNAYPSQKRLVLIASAYFCLLITLSIISTITVNLSISLLRLFFQKINLLTLQPSDDAYYFLAFLFQEGMLLLTAWLCLRFSVQDKHFLEKPFLIKSKTILYGFVSAMFLLASSTALNYLTQFFYGDLKDPITQRFQSFSLIYKILFAILGSLIAPVCEEFLFRRALFGMFRQYGYVQSGIIFSSVLFTILHFGTFAQMGIFYFVSFLIAGVLLSVIYHKTNSILASIIAHILVNTIGFILNFYWFT